MIPRRLHWIWLGPNPIPEEFVGYIEGWKRLHPLWEYCLWTDDNLPERIQNRAQFENAAHYAQASDILRLEVIYQYGGVYIDMDFECVRNIASLCEGIDMFCGTEDGVHYCDGLFGAVPGHPAVKEAIDALPASMVEYGHLPINMQTGPGFTTRVWKGRKDVWVYPKEFFYPYGWHEKHRKSESFLGAYAIHHWAGSWVQR